MVEFYFNAISKWQNGIQCFFYITITVFGCWKKDTFFTQKVTFFTEKVTFFTQKVTFFPKKLHFLHKSYLFYEGRLFCILSASECLHGELQVLGLQGSNLKEDIPNKKRSQISLGFYKFCVEQFMQLYLIFWSHSSFLCLLRRKYSRISCETSFSICEKILHVSRN